MKLEFEWDEAKDEENYKKHGISFETAVKVFEDPFAIEFLDDRRDFTEERFVIFGMITADILYVAYTEREDRIRMISARKATMHEQKEYFKQNGKTSKLD